MTELAYEADLITGLEAHKATYKLKWETSRCSCGWWFVLSNRLAEMMYSSSIAVLGDTSDTEAIATMEIIKIAFSELGESSGQNRRLVLITVPEVFTVLEEGATVLLVLSKNVLKCKQVLRGLLLATSGQRHRAIVPIFPDRLEFTFPDDDDLGALFQLAEEAFLVKGDNDKQVNPLSPHQKRFSLVSAHQQRFAESPKESKTTASQADDVVHLLLWIFKLIALPLSTHGSWATLQHQFEHIFYRAIATDGSGGPMFDPNQFRYMKAHSPLNRDRFSRSSSNGQLSSKYSKASPFSTSDHQSVCSNESDNSTFLVRI